MERIDRIRTLALISGEIQRIQPESENDEAASEYAGELQSVVNAIQAGGTDEAVLASAKLVDAVHLLVFA